jgi:hypothetical protein
MIDGTDSGSKFDGDRRTAVLWYSDSSMSQYSWCGVVCPRAHEALRHTIVIFCCRHSKGLIWNWSRDDACHTWPVSRGTCWWQLRHVAILLVLHVRISLCCCGRIMCLASGRCSLTHGEAEKNSVLVAICFHLLLYATLGCHRPTSRVTLPSFKAPDVPPSIATIR